MIINTCNNNYNYNYISSVYRTTCTCTMQYMYSVYTCKSCIAIKRMVSLCNLIRNSMAGNHNRNQL